MVLPPSSTPEGQARGRDRWLKEIRRWLHLGHDGVLIAVRDAKPWGLRPLARLLAEVDHQRHLLLDAKELTTLEPGALALLIVRAEDLDWLNLNRPILAQQKLRVVLWVEEALGTPFKFQSPDLHDWVSHFVPCPRGVPNFAMEGLRLSSSWWPGAAWTGPYLDIALEDAGIETQTVNAKDPFEELVQRLRADRRGSVCWEGVDSPHALWRVRWACAEARHTGFCVLHNPGVNAPGWFPVDSSQPTDALIMGQLASGDLITAIENELEFEAVLGAHADVDTLERWNSIGLLSYAGPELRRLHTSSDMQQWRRALIQRMWSKPTESWSQHALAMFASLERDRQNWPEWKTGFVQKCFDHEHQLRVTGSPSASFVATLPEFDDVELEQRWDLRPLGPRASPVYQRMLAPHEAPDVWSDIDRAPIHSLADEAGWHSQNVLHAFARWVLEHLDDHDALRGFLAHSMRAAERELGLVHPAVLELRWVAVIAMALLAPSLVDALYLDGPFFAPLSFEAAAIATLLGRFSQTALLCEEHELPPDSPEFHLYIAALRAAGEHAKVKEVLGDDAEDFPIEDPQDLAREYLIERLRAR